MLVENSEETSRGRDNDYMASKMSLFTNLLFPTNLYYSASLYSKHKAAMASARTETVSESREKKVKILIAEIAKSNVAKYH